MRTLSRLVAALGLAMLACSLVAADDYDEYYDVDANMTTTETASMPTSSPAITSTPTTSPPSSSTMGPTSPPTPTDPKAQIYTWNDFNDTSKVCLNMSAVFEVSITDGQNTSLVNVTLAQNGQHGVVANVSTCQIEEQKATIFISDAKSVFSLAIVFNGTTDVWSIQSFGMIYESAPYSLNSTLDRNTQNVSSTRSFQCKKQDFVFTNMSANPNKILPKVTVKSLQVQVFKFKDGKGGLGNGISCTTDASQNKIVPIAVGAALAGLVVVVLIAYLIGRLRSRKQSSYEALS